MVLFLFVFYLYLYFLLHTFAWNAMQAALNLSREPGAEMSEIKPQFGFLQIWEILKSGLKWDCRWA